MQSAPVANSGFRGVRVSRFRHVYGSTARREQCYEGLRVGMFAHDTQACAVNPKFIAVIIEVTGGGAFQVLPLRWVGKIDYHTGRIGGHNGPVTDLKWDPFNDNIIASSSDDATVKLWHIADDIHQRASNLTTNWLVELTGHTRRVTYIEWHPTAENLLATAAMDHRILLWNASNGECLTAVDCHEDTIYSMTFNTCGSMLATICKDHYLRVIDPRTGQVLQQGIAHDGVKAFKAVFVGEHDDKVLTTGATKASRRQIALWNRDDLSRPLLLQDIDFSSGVLMPFYDRDLSIVYIAGKGDGNIRYYEVVDCPPYLHYLSEFQSRFPQRGLGTMPKRGMNVNECEVFRFYKVHATQALLEPISFIVPRKSDVFQADLYPPTAGPTPATTAEEWLCGMDRTPVEISLRAGFVPATTCKPVQVVNRQVGDNRVATLVTSDPNNDRKFRFLAEVTKPDYREISQRDDYAELVRLQELQERILERHAIRQSSESGGSSLGSPTASRPMSTNDGDLRLGQQRLQSPPPNATVSSSSLPLAPLSIQPTPCPGQQQQPSPSKVRRLDHNAPPLGEINGNGHSPSSRNICLGRVVECAPMEQQIITADTTSSSSARSSSTSAAARREIKALPISADKLHPSSTRPGSIGPRAVPVMLRANEQTTAHVRPFRIEQRPRQPKPLANIRSSSVGEQCQFGVTSPTAIGEVLPFVTTSSVQQQHHHHHQQQQQQQQIIDQQAEKSNSAASPVLPASTTTTSSRKTNESELQKLYNSQCGRVREMLVAEEGKERRISQLENDIASLTGKYERSLTDNRRQHDDIVSLRYEIDWKDERIRYLEQQLQKVTAISGVAPVVTTAPKATFEPSSSPEPDE